MAKILSASYLRKIVNIKNQYKFIRSFISTANLKWNSALFGEQFWLFI